MTALTTLSPLLQLGFAGFSLILIGVLCWLVRIFVQSVRQTTKVIAANTAAIIALTGRTEQTDRHLREMRDETLRHGCPFGFPARPQLTAQPGT